MKKLFIVLAVAALTYLAFVHIDHETLVEGYRMGCRDVLKEAAKNDALELSDVIVNSYCESLSNRYVNKK